jgi:SAM-dependent methyltransferase
VVRRPGVQLFLASALMLFVELVLIRWSGAYVVYLSYFSNIVLLGSFLGIGIGFLRRGRSPDLFRWYPFALVAYLGLLKGAPVTIDRSGDDLVFFGALVERGLPVWVMLPLIFLASAAIMAMIAQGVADRFARFAPLEAYRLDIVGSLAGIAAFSLLAWTSSPPLAWGIVIVALSAPLVIPRALDIAAAVALLAVTALATFQGPTTWSPYYRLETLRTGTTWSLRANGVPHQAIEEVRANLTSSQYTFPYAALGAPPVDVLVIGAGNGNDVAAALASGASHVDAVEIDGAIQEIGAALHPDRPYDDPRVERIVDDGRAFLENTDRTYDLILFALPDSLTLVSGQSGIRLESYLFTEEAIAAARDRLRPGGAFAMYNFYREPWLLDRLGGSLAIVFGQPPCVRIQPTSSLIGSYAMLIVGRDRATLTCDELWSPTGPVVEPASDDHPFVYLRERTVPGRYVWTLALILGVSLLAVRRAAGTLGSLRPYADLFCMGAAFLLLETRSLVGFALLFGATWFVNALAFGGILLAVLGAIEIQRRWTIQRTWILYGALFVCLAVAALVPVASLLDLDPVPRFLAASLLAFFPIFAANLVFAGRFRTAEDSTAAFGANLLGAMLGGTLEYLALITGYRALLAFVAVLYALAWMLGRRRADDRHAVAETT